MQIIVHSGESLKAEMLKQGVDDGHDIIWIQHASDFTQYTSAHAWIDLLFEPSSQRIQLLSGLTNGIVIINSVIQTLQEMQVNFVRINGWKTFLSSALLEASGNPSLHAKAEMILSVFHKQARWLADKSGFITARVVSMIINEAFISLGEKVSTKEDINTAMKLGTNYPYGPFEWADLIGIENVRQLLIQLSSVNPRYSPGW